MSSSSGSEIEEIQMQIDANKNLTDLNESLHVIEESPVKLKGLSSASRSNYGKRKLSRIHQSYESKLRKVLSINILEDQANNDHIGEDKNSLNSIANKIKSKIHNEETTRAEKLQILTLVPSEWSRKKAAEIFEVSERTV